MTDRRPEVEVETPERGLEDAILVLQEEIPVRPEWRAQLEQRLSVAPVPRRPRFREWRVGPVAGIAAALVFMMIGSVATLLLRPQVSGVDSVAAGDTLPASFASRSLAGEFVGVRFAVLAQGAARVSLVGDFNGWNPDATPLRLASDGKTWMAMLPLRAGRHTYAFVIDGEIVADPSAPRATDDDFGTPSSLMLVSSLP